MKMHRARLIAAVAVLMTLATGALTSCGSDSDPDPKASASPSISEPIDALPSDTQVEAYFAAVASYDPDLLSATQEVTAPDSIAATYAAYLLELSRAAIDSGDPVPGAEIEGVSGGFRACGGTGSADECVVWADFQGVSGKLADFTVNDTDLGPRLVAGDDPAVPAGSLGDVQLEFAYQSVQSQDLFVVVRVRADEDVTILSDRASYLGADETLTPTRFIGPTGTPAGSTATVAIVFPQVAVGGVVTLDLVGPAQHRESVQLTTG